MLKASDSDELDWAERNPRRWRSELEQIYDRFPGMLLEFAERDRRELRGEVVVRDRPRFVRLVWPSNYPWEPPLVTELESTGAPVDHSGTHHQFRDSALCLYTQKPGKDGWSPEYSAADALDRFVIFREQADEDGHIPVHFEGHQGYAGFPAFFAVWVPGPLAVSMNEKGAWGVCRGHWGGAGSALVIQEIQGRDVAHVEELDPGWRESMGLFLPLIGAWACVDVGNRSWRELLPSREVLRILLKRNISAKASRALLESPVLLLSRSGDPSDILAIPNIPPELLALTGLDSVGWSSKRARVGNLQASVFNRVDGAISGREALSKCRAILIGLGSLGSHVALALAKAGVGQFDLFDAEELEPENVCRHVGTLSQVGALKTDIVKRAILQRNPDARVASYGSHLSWDRVGGTRSPSKLLEQGMQEPHSIVIVTAAVGLVERAVNRKCIEQGRPLIIASVLGEAEHGRVLRVLPGETPCYQCVLLAQEREPEHYPRLGDPGGVHPGVGAYHQPGIPGLSIDIEQVALLTARLSLQTFGRMIELGYPDSEGDHLLWSARGNWIFDRPLQVRVERYPRYEDCPACGNPETVSEDDLEWIALLEEELRTKR